MPTATRYIGLFFALLAALFLILTARDVLGNAPARRAHLRIGLIFAAVSFFLLFFHGRLP